MWLDITDLFAVGIGCDLAGAYLLAKGLLVTPQALARRGTFAGLKERFVDDAEDRALASVGVAALVVGFVIQALGYALTLAVGAAEEPSWGRGVVALGLASAVTVGVLLFEGKTRRRRLQALIVDTASESRQANPTTALAHLVTGAERLGVERRADEDDLAYARRAFGPSAVVGLAPE